MVSRRGLSSGLLVGRGAAEPLLPRRYPAQASEAAQELSDAREGHERRGLSRGAAEAVVDRDAQAGVWHRRNGDARLVRGVGLVKQIEHTRGGFDEVARRAEAGLARYLSEPDQIFAGLGARRVEAKRL